MVKLNSLLQEDNLNSFTNVTKRVNEYKKNHPKDIILSLGVGDVSKPIIKPVIKKMKEAVDDLSDIKTFHGYGASYGYDFLKDVILKNEYQDFHFTNDELYISNGTKTDTTSILELFDINSKICAGNPIYPIYKDGAKALNRKITFLDGLEENNFIPDIPKEHYDLIYICSPNNPTGTCYTYKDLTKWVEYALKNNAVILYDNVYNSFIESSDVPKSIYEIPGSKKVAIEFRSFSKCASFTGVRCSYYIIPNEICENINELWKLRTINRFNGADYIAQLGASSVYTKESQELIRENILYYKNNSKLLRDFFTSHGFKVYGGVDAPFLWIKIKNGMTSWDYFDYFLKEFGVIIIPGIIFGSNGNNYFRVSALASHDTIMKVIERINESGKEIK